MLLSIGLIAARVEPPPPAPVPNGPVAPDVLAAVTRLRPDLRAGQSGQRGRPDGRAAIQCAGGGHLRAAADPHAAEAQLLAQLDALPYVPASATGAIPFVDIADRFVVSGATYDAAVLSGATVASVAGALQNPTSAQAQAIVGSANVLTAAVCSVTGEIPAEVCDQPTVQQLRDVLAAVAPA